MKDAGLRSLPGTAAEILDDPVREILCPDKINTEEWLEAHRIAHSVGLRSNVTIMFGAVETPRSWARHIAPHARPAEGDRRLHRVRAAAVRAHGVADLPQASARRGPTFRETLLMHAVGRIAYHGQIDNIQASWVKIGMGGLRQLLQAGVNDAGGTLMNENISRAAGASHGQSLDEAALADIVASLGRPLEQRTTLYGRVENCRVATDEFR